MTATAVRMCWWLACAAVIAGAVVRLYALGTDSFSGDEVWYIHTAAPRLLVQAGADGPPLPTLATRAALRWGYGEFTLRLPSALAGIALLAALW